MRRLLDVARKEKVRRITAEILPENDAMQKICKALGFRLDHDAEEGVIKAQIDL